MENTNQIKVNKVKEMEMDKERDIIDNSNTVGNIKFRPWSDFVMAL
jgi:hypothetical protein